MLPLGNIIRKHNINFHCYADDTQLHLSLKPGDTNRLSNLQACLKDIKTWMTPAEQTVLDVLGTIPLPAGDAQVVMEHFKSLYQTVAQQAMMRALS